MNGRVCESESGKWNSDNNRNTGLQTLLSLYGPSRRIEPVLGMEMCEKQTNRYGKEECNSNGKTQNQWDELIRPKK